MARSDILRIKDELLETMLDSFRSDDLLRKNLILQGGGALHFIYGSPRHSNDLDFVCEDLKNIQDEVKDRFKKGIEFNGTKIVPELKNLDSSYPDRPFIRAKYSLGQNQPTVSLELLSQKSFDNSATIIERYISGTSVNNLDQVAFCSSLVIGSVKDFKNLVFSY